MSVEGFDNSDQERSLAERVRDGLLRAAPEHGDLIMGRDVVVTAYCEANGISKDEITMEQLLEVRALPEWQDPFNIKPSIEEPETVSADHAITANLDAAETPTSIHLRLDDLASRAINRNP